MVKSNQSVLFQLWICSLSVLHYRRSLVRDDPAAFASAAFQLAQTSELWRQLVQAGKKTVSKHYSPEAARRRRNEIYATIVQNARGVSA